jgi:hypothetical protein
MPLPTANLKIDIKIDNKNFASEIGEMRYVKVQFFSS